MSDNASGFLSFAAILSLGLLVLITFPIAQGTNDAASAAAAVFVIGSLALYFAPTAVAALRGHRYLVAISALNFLLGWTVIGWVGALVWAYSNSLSDNPLVTLARSAEQTSTDTGMRACPFCAEPVRRAAIKCKHCSSEIDPIA